MLSKHSKISVKVENTPTIMFAAENLQKYLTKILGCSVVIDANEFDCPNKIVPEFYKEINIPE